jgi:predicted DCC family thiol-disulfide oxidoreductase YuxK
MDVAARGAICPCMRDNDDPAAAEAVFYDGACPICRREIAAYRGMRGMDAVEWLDVTDAGTDLGGLDRQAALRRFHARRADGAVVSGASAFLAVWRRNRRLRPLAVALDRQPFRAALELGYRGFLGVRPLWRR